MPKKSTTPLLLVVLDGWGHSDDPNFNAIHSAETPNWDRLWAHAPHMLIDCSGHQVGLPDGQMGNSEVGHMHLGAGRCVDQDYTRISKALTEGSLAANPVLCEAIAHAATHGTAVHLLGLLSPGGVHSHESHIFALLEMAARNGVGKICVHAFLDGRDTPPQSASASLAQLETHCRTLGVGHLASIIGRYYAMDRNKNWARTKSAYDLLVAGEATETAPDPQTALQMAYARGETDEFVQATAICDSPQSATQIRDGDVVLFCNFRADRARQLTAALTQPNFPHFARRELQLGAFVTMTDYGDRFDVPVAFPPLELTNTFGELIAARGLKQLRIAETEKYAHVTFFFNGGEEREFPGEDRILIPSPQVATYDLKPEMSAPEVTTELTQAIAARTYDVIICNYANADMVGHTGNFEATVKCIEVLDACLARVLACCRDNGTEILITADHGNAEKMRSFDLNGSGQQPHTAHTSNLVPLIYVGRAAEMAASGGLMDIAPTMLNIMGLPQPTEMTGRSLVRIDRDAQDAA